MSYDAMVLDGELKDALQDVMGVEALETEELSGFTCMELIVEAFFPCKMPAMRKAARLHNKGRAFKPAKQGQKAAGRLQIRA